MMNEVITHRVEKIHLVVMQTIDAAADVMSTTAGVVVGRRR
jgi:hypothetical protein